MPKPLNDIGEWVDSVNTAFHIKRKGTYIFTSAGCDYYTYGKQPLYYKMRQSIE